MERFSTKRELAQEELARPNAVVPAKDIVRFEYSHRVHRQLDLACEPSFNVLPGSIVKTGFRRRGHS